ncbi:MAG: aminotransferase class V-fold PLP-dependent enzyme, partial [Chloroflexota bacterium]
RLATGIPGLKVYGLTDIEKLDERTPTFAISLAGYSPEELAGHLGEQGFFVWHGHYYAVAVMERLGTLNDGGLVRIGFVHYNTVEEMDRLFNALRGLTANEIG